MNLNRISPNGFKPPLYKQVVPINECRKMTKDEFSEILIILTNEFKDNRGRK